MTYPEKATVVELVGGELEDKQHWNQLVREAAKDRCGNCGGDDRTRTRMIIPVEAGGRYVVSNGILLCRPCELTLDAMEQGKRREQDRRILNFWVSRKLYDRIQRIIEARNGFNSVSALVRYSMSKYIVDEARFDDLEQHQDSGTDVKINVWVDIGTYSTYKRLVDKRGMTVTDSVKSLLLIHLEIKANMGLGSEP
jgi:hypothetical protein